MKPTFADWYTRRALSGIDERDVLEWEAQGLIRVVAMTISLNPGFGTIDIVRAHPPVPAEYDYSGIHVSTGFGPCRTMGGRSEYTERHYLPSQRQIGRRRSVGSRLR
jgi:hypothetical protein